MGDPITMPPNHPYAVAHIDGRAHPALILEWAKVQDANGYFLTYARVAYAVDGQAVVKLVPASRVERA